MNSQKLIVVGGVAAGPAAASRARRVKKDMEIVVYERGPFNSYGACNEPYYIGGVIDDYNKFLARSPEEFKKNHNIDVMLEHEVINIDAGNKSILVKNLKSGEEFTDYYDKLILATGTETINLQVNGTDLHGVFRIKELTDMIAIKEYIDLRHPQKVVTLGAGFIALEMAEAFSNLGMENTIVLRSTMPMGRLDNDISQLILDEIRARDIEFMPGVDFKGISESGNGLSVQTSTGNLHADMVLVAVGVRPNVKLAKEAGISIGKTGAIVVDEKQCTSIEGIYAAGDCCEVIHRIGGNGVNIVLGDVSNKQGWVAGENAAGGDIIYPGVLGSAHFKFFDLEVAFTGLSEGEANKLGLDTVSYTTEGLSRVEAMPGSAPVLIKFLVEKVTGRLLGAQMIGRDGVANRINTLAMALYNGNTVKEIAEVDFAYAPPFSPVIDPILRAARGAEKAVM